MKSFKEVRHLVIAFLVIEVGTGLSAVNAEAKGLCTDWPLAEARMVITRNGKELYPQSIDEWFLLWCPADVPYSGLKSAPYLVNSSPYPRWTGACTRGRGDCQPSLTVACGSGRDGTANYFYVGPSYVPFCNGVRATPYTCDSPGNWVCPMPAQVNTEKVEPRCENMVGNPIDLTIGAKFETQEDFSSPSWWLGWVRYYNSKQPIGRVASYVSPWGRGWRSPYTNSILTAGLGAMSDVVIAVRPKGATYSFERQPDGSYQGSEDVVDRLIPLPSGEGGSNGWRYVNVRDRLLEEYSSSGKLIKVARIDGRSVALDYEENRLVRVRDDFGRQAQFAYSGDQISSITFGEYSVRYGYAADGTLISATFPDATTREYRYDEDGLSGSLTLTGLLTGVVDESGTRYSTFTYNDQGQAVSTELAGGVSKWQLTYSGADSATTVVDPRGTSRAYSLKTVRYEPRIASQSQPGGSGCGPASSAIGYDANGNVSSRTDFDGHKTTYTYDLTRNLELTRTEGAGTTAARTISTTWHPDWRLEAQRAEPKKLTTWVYNGQPDPTAGNAVATCAPSDALLPDGKPIVVLCKQIEQASTDETGTAGFSATVTGNPRISTWTYTRYGQVLTADGPRTDVNDVTTTTYYDIADPDLGKRGNVATIANALGHVTEFTSYDANGRVTGITDPNGVATRFSYDPRGRLTAKTVGGETTSYSYDPVGQLTAVSMPDGTSLTYTYDPAHRLTAIADGAGNRVQYTLDAAGNRVKEEVLDPEGRLVLAQTRVYDTLGRLQNLVQPQ